MLLLLVYHNLALRTVGAIPITSGDENVSSTCFDLRQCRSIWSIIWSCLVTISLCTWVAIHRNMPDPTSQWHSVTLARVGMAVWALLAPELILFWAIQQWLVAGEIAHINEKAKKDRIIRSELERIFAEESAIPGGAAENNRGNIEEGEGIAMEDMALLAEPNGRLAEPNGGVVERNAEYEDAEIDDKEWTRTHGFFVVMGGFYLFDGKKPLHPLSREEVKDLVEKGLLLPPSEDEIQDKSKGDALSKTIVLIQVMWFVIQCTARRIRRLPVTELEVVTLAYTAVNLAIYAFWWHKPLSVMRPVRVVGGPLAHAQDRSSGGEGEVGGHWRKWKGGLVYFIRVVGGTQDHNIDLSKEKRVPTFYAGQPKSVHITIAFVISLFMAAIFGAIHCIAWPFLFPSHTEKLLWRASCVAILAYPIILALLLLVRRLEKHLNKRVESASLSILFVLVFVGNPAYIVARVFLLVVAFTALRSLPPEAYETVPWTNLIPHI